MYLEEEVARINELFSSLRGKGSIFIWGAAENTVNMFRFTDILGYSIKGIIDNKVTGSFFGKKIYKPAQVNWKNVDAVVISSFNYAKEIEIELLNQWCFLGTIIKIYDGKQKRAFYEHLSYNDVEVPELYQEVIKKNSKFHRIHEGKRIFILCCGPSIKDMNLSILQNEFTMDVSSFYLHKDISNIKPKYHCSTEFIYTSKLSKDSVVRYMRELEDTLGDVQYFFSLQEKDLIEKHGLFQNKRVNYFYFKHFCKSFYEDIDLCSAIMPVHSVPVLCIELAVYMGFKEIYLLGAEHDSILTNQYLYFYEKKDSVFEYTDISVDATGKLSIDFSASLTDTYFLWEDYKIVKRIAEEKGIKIYNATIGGILDLFDRVEFDSLFNGNG